MWSIPTHRVPRSRIIKAIQDPKAMVLIIPPLVTVAPYSPTPSNNLVGSVRDILQRLRTKGRDKRNHFEIRILTNHKESLGYFPRKSKYGGREFQEKCKVSGAADILPALESDEVD